MRREDGALCVKVSVSGLFAVLQRHIKIGWRGKMWVVQCNGWLVTDARRVTSCVATASGLKDHSSQSVSCWANGVSVTHPTINYLCPQLVNERVAPLRRDEAGEEEEEERFGREKECERVKEKERLLCGNKKTDWEGTEGEVTLGEHKRREKKWEAEHQSENKEK